MGGSSPDGNTVIQYAPYVNDAHGALINFGWQAGGFDSGSGQMTMAGQSPYGNYSLWNPDYPFFGKVLSDGSTIDSPELDLVFDNMVRKVDVFALNDTIVASQVDNAQIDALIAAENTYLEDDLNQNTLPRIRAHLSDIGSVMTSSFIDAETMVEMNKQKVIAKYSADLKIKAYEVAQGIWSKSLEWNQQVVNQQMNLLKLYFMTRMDYINAKVELDSRNILWPYTVLDHQRAIVACLQNSRAGHVAGDDKVMKTIAGALALTSIGSQVAGWMGSPMPDAGSIGQSQGMGEGPGPDWSVADSSVGQAATQSDFDTLGVGLMSGE